MLGPCKHINISDKAGRTGDARRERNGKRRSRTEVTAAVLKIQLKRRKPTQIKEKSYSAILYGQSEDSCELMQY